jgi:tetratricopeptide (TPR) repeat protein
LTVDLALPIPVLSPFFAIDDMTTITLTLLDQAELLQLALNASRAGDSATAIGYLKEAVSRPDAGGIAHYLLGAEYAQIGMYQRAAGEMEAALALEPGLSMARLQLGLLWLGAGDGDRAQAVMAPLEELASGDPLRLFGAGLRHLAADRLAEARACLQEGIGCNSANAALNGDMGKIVDQLDAMMAPGQADTPGAGAGADGVADGMRHLLLSAYTGKSSP